MKFSAWLAVIILLFAALPALAQEEDEAQPNDPAVVMTAEEEAPSDEVFIPEAPAVERAESPPVAAPTPIPTCQTLSECLEQSIPGTTVPAGDPGNGGGGGIR